VDVAVVGQDAALTDLCAFAARRRGHNVVCVDETRRLLGAMPFVPSISVLNLGDLGEQEVADVAALAAHYPEMHIVVASERPGRGALDIIRAGALDVVPVPYDPSSLITRIETLVQRACKGRAEGSVISVADLAVDLGKYAAQKNGVSVTMTKLELRLLFCLCEHYPSLAPTERLLTFGWEGSMDADPALIKTHISHIRTKLRAAGGVDLQIRSRQTLGYELAAG
jgi:DNA-binding response OmpR family regulator